MSRAGSDRAAVRDLARRPSSRAPSSQLGSNRMARIAEADAKRITRVSPSGPVNRSLLDLAIAGAAGPVQRSACGGALLIASSALRATASSGIRRRGLIRVLSIALGTMTRDGAGSSRGAERLASSRRRGDPGSRPARNQHQGRRRLALGPVASMGRARSARGLRPGSGMIVGGGQLDGHVQAAASRAPSPRSSWRGRRQGRA